MRKVNLSTRPTKAFWRAYNGLYGEPATTLAPQVVKSPVRAPNALKTPLEREEQARLCVWLDKRDILYYAIPNGGKRGKVEAYTLKRTGLKAGVPDLCLPIPMPEKSYHGLYIELKRVFKGMVTEEQKSWLEKLNKLGYLAVVAHGCDAAITIVKNYLNLKD